jgi:hypothetical protein
MALIADSALHDQPNLFLQAFRDMEQQTLREKEFRSLVLSSE